MVQLEENLTHKFVKRGSWMYLFAFLTGPVGYAIKIIISHDLSVSELGMLYGVFSFILLIGSLNDLGMVESLNYFAPKFLAQKKLGKALGFFVYAGVAMFLTSLVTSLLLYYGADWLSSRYFKADGESFAAIRTILQIFCIYLFVSNVQHFLSTVAIVYQDTKVAKGIEALRLLASLGFAFQVFITGSGALLDYAKIWNYGTMISTAVGAVSVWYRHLKGLVSEARFVFSREDLAELFRYSGWALLANNASFILSQIDMQLLYRMAGPGEAGIYTNYLSLIAIPFIVLTPIIGLILPVVSAFHGAERKLEITTIITVFTRLFSLLAIMVMAVTALYADGMGTFFFGPKFQESGVIMYWSIGFIIFNFLLQVNFNLLAAVGKVKKRLRIVLIGLVCNVILNIILISYHGAAGSALAVGMSWAVIWYLSYRETREYHRPFAWGDFIKNFLFFLPLTIAFWFVPRNIELIGRAGYIISISGATIAFCLVFALVNLKDIKQTLQTLKKPAIWKTLT